MTRPLASLRRILVVLAVPALAATCAPAVSAATAAPMMHQMTGGGGFIGCCPGD